MKLSELTKSEKEIILECLKTAAYAPFFLGDSDAFNDVFMIKPSDIGKIISEWPDVNECSEDVRIAINTSLHILSQRYQHYGEIWNEYLSVPQDEIKKLDLKFTNIISDLTDYEKKIVLECLRAAASEHFFPDGLFNTLLGYDRSEFQTVISTWPNINEQSEHVRGIVYQALSQLSFFPNGYYDNLPNEIWQSYISVPFENVNALFYKYSGKRKPVPKKWDGIINGSFTSKSKVLWNRLKSLTQIRYLTNGWCPKCEKNTIITSYQGAIDIDGGITIYGGCVECSSEIEIIISIEDIENDNNSIKRNK